MTPQIPTINRDVISPGECLSEGRALITEKYWLMFGICFVGYLLAPMGPFYLLYGPMLCGISYCYLALKRGEEFQFSDLFKGFGVFGTSYLTGLIQMLPVLILSIFVYVPLMIFLVAAGPQRGDPPGNFFAYFYGGFWIVWSLIMIVSALMHFLFVFSFPLVVEWNLSAGDALKASLQAIRANPGGLVGLFFLCGLVNLIGALVCGIGIYFTLPLTHAAWTVAYRRIFPEPPPHSGLPPDPPKFREWTGEAAV